MTTATEALFTPVQYFTALDPYNWQVDNRPLSDLEANEVILSEGIETAFHAGKLNSAALGTLIRALSGGSPNMMGKLTLSGVALTASIEYAAFISNTTVSGKTVSLVGIQPDTVNFALTAPASGSKKLYVISAKYQTVDSDLPYFDAGLPLDATQIVTGNLEYEVVSSTVLLAAPDSYPANGVGFTEILHIKVLATDTIINPDNVVYQYFIPEGQAFNYASQTRAGQVLFATPTEVTTGTNTTKAVTPADLKDRIDAIPQATDAIFGIVQFADSAEVTAGTSTNRVVTPADLKDRIDAIPAGDFVTTTDGIKHGINANLRMAPNYLDNTDDLNDIRHSGTWLVEGSANCPPHCHTGKLQVDGHDGGAPGASGSSFWIQTFVSINAGTGDPYENIDGRVYTRRISGSLPNSSITTFGRWVEAFTKYRMVPVETINGNPPTELVLTADDFGSHSMFLCAPIYADIHVSVPGGILGSLKAGQAVHIRNVVGGTGDVIIKDYTGLLLPGGDYTLRTVGSTVSLVFNTFPVTSILIIGEMP